MLSDGRLPCRTPTRPENPPKGRPWIEKCPSIRYTSKSERYGGSTHKRVAVPVPFGKRLSSYASSERKIMPTETAGPEPRELDFSNTESTSYSRTYSEGMVIRPRGRFRYVVRFTDSDNSHISTIAKDGPLVGYCNCKGDMHHDGPCAHLWALKIAEQREVIDIPHVREALSGGDSCPRCGASPVGSQR